MIFQGTMKSCFVTGICSRVPTKRQCSTMVDMCSPLFFVQWLERHENRRCCCCCCCWSCSSLCLVAGKKDEEEASDALGVVHCSSIVAESAEMSISRSRRVLTMQYAESTTCCCHHQLSTGAAALSLLKATDDWLPCCSSSVTAAAAFEEGSMSTCAILDLQMLSTCVTKTVDVSADESKMSSCRTTLSTYRKIPSSMSVGMLCVAHSLDMSTMTKDVRSRQNMPAGHTHTHTNVRSTRSRSK